MGAQGNHWNMSMMHEKLLAVVITISNTDPPAVSELTNEIHKSRWPDRSWEYFGKLCIMGIWSFPKE